MEVLGPTATDRDVAVTQYAEVWKLLGDAAVMAFQYPITRLTITLVIKRPRALSYTNRWSCL